MAGGKVAKETARVNQSNGVTQVGALVDAKTARALVHKGEAVVQTPGATGFDVVKLASAAKDTQYTAATTQAPVAITMDHIVFKPSQFPEPANY